MYAVLSRPCRLEARNHHETEHRKKEDACVDQETRGCCDPSLGDIHESAQHHLGDLVRLGVRHEEEYQSRYEGILRLQHQIQHPLTLITGNYCRIASRRALSSFANPPHDHDPITVL